MVRRSCSLAVAAAILVALVACGSSATSTSSQSGKTYKFGVLAPLTGSNATNGATSKKGIDLAVTQINNSNLLIGAKIEAVYADNQADPTVTVSAFNQLVTIDKVPLSLTSYSGPTLAIAPIAERNKVALINIGAVTPSLAGASSYLFNAVPLITLQARAVLNYAVKTKSYKKIALYYSSDDLGKGTEADFAKYVSAAGGTYVGGVAFDPKSTEYRLTLAKLQTLGPDAVYITSTATQTGNIIAQAAGSNFKPIWMGYQSFSHEATLRVGGKDAEGGLYATTSITDPAIGKEYPETKAFEDAFTATYGAGIPDYTSYTAYESVEIYGHALANLIKQNKGITGANFKSALSALKMTSVLGPVQFQQDGTVLVPLQIKTVQNGAFVGVKTYTVADLKKLG